MQYSDPFNELYDEVIKNACQDFGIEAHRADETFGPGVIIADMLREIIDAEFVIAEITPSNPNVFYEIGYAHAIAPISLPIPPESQHFDNFRHQFLRSYERHL